MKRRARADTLNIFVMEEYVSHFIPSGVQAPERYVDSPDVCAESKPRPFSGFVFLISDSYSSLHFRDYPLVNQAIHFLFLSAI